MKMIKKDILHENQHNAYKPRKWFWQFIYTYSKNIFAVKKGKAKKVKVTE